MPHEYILRALWLSSNQMQFKAVDNISIKASLGYHGLFQNQSYLTYLSLFCSKLVMQLEKPRNHQVGVPDPFLCHIPQSTELISEAGPTRHSSPTAAIRSVDMRSEWNGSQSQGDCHPAAQPVIVYRFRKTKRTGTHILCAYWYAYMHHISVRPLSHLLDIGHI